jgi:hypothetical protein
MVDLHTDVYSIRNLVSISESKEEAYRRFARLHGISIDKPTALKVFDNAIHQKFPKVIEKTLLEKVQAKYDIENLPLTEITERGVTFKTGKPVTFNFIRNTGSSKQYGIPQEKYQQNLEPTGKYMLHSEGTQLLPEWEEGSISFQKPLVIKFHLNDDMAYDDKSWKAVLSNYYGKTGKGLTQALVNAGYDGIVTVDKKHTSEIIALKPKNISERLADFGKYVSSTARPRVFYRGINPGETKRIKTGNDVWDSYLFACDSPEKAKWYGDHIVIINAKPTAKILYEKTPEFNKIVKTIKKGKNLLDFASEVAEKAKEQGYHAVWFERQTDIGTVMMVPSEFVVNR